MPAWVKSFRFRLLGLFLLYFNCLLVCFAFAFGLLVFGKFDTQYGVNGFNKLHHRIIFILENEINQQQHLVL